MAMLDVALDPATVVVAVDPGKVMNRVWVSDGSGLLEEPVSLPVARDGIVVLERMLAAHAGEQVIAIEATGNLHRAWAAESGASPSRVVAAVRAFGDQGCSDAVGLGPVQDR